LIKKAINEYPFVDIMRDPPSAFSSFKFDEKLEIENLNVDNGLDFYSEIVRITNKMQDCHHIFVPPFLQYFVYFLPFEIDSEPESSGLGRRFKFTNYNNNASFSDIVVRNNCLTLFIFKFEN
jgi:hypothetical protein